MSVRLQPIGNTVAEWNSVEPLEWVMREMQGEGKHEAEVRIKINLKPLLAGYTKPFLFSLKKVFIERRLRVSLRSIKTESKGLINLLRACQKHFQEICNEHKITPDLIERIDSDFLLGLAEIQDKVSHVYLEFFKQLYSANKGNGDLFSPDIHPGDIPTGQTRKKPVERFRQNILSSVFNRSTIVQIFNITESAYDNGDLDLGCFSFSRLMFCRAARPETYRLLRCKDLRIDTIGGVKNYFLTLSIPKARTAIPPKADIRIHPDVGLLLEKQREAVVNRLAHLVEEKNKDINTNDQGESMYTNGDLPLFPSPRRMWSTTKESLGMLKSSVEFVHQYVHPLKELTGEKLSCTALRHTIATQLAIAGCSSTTIAAVLLHSTPYNAKVYVDLIFEGAIDMLSSSLEAAFTEHFPAFNEFASSKDPITPERRVVSSSSDRLRRETTGECGRSEACQYAPLACYECRQFKPCYDTDHTINLDAVNIEILAAQDGGHQRQADVMRYKHIANCIRVVITACDNKRIAIESERRAVNAKDKSDS